MKQSGTKVMMSSSAKKILEGLKRAQCENSGKLGMRKAPPPLTIPPSFEKGFNDHSAFMNDENRHDRAASTLAMSMRGRYPFPAADVLRGMREQVSTSGSEPKYHVMRHPSEQLGDPFGRRVDASSFSSAPPSSDRARTRSIPSSTEVLLSSSARRILKGLNQAERDIRKPRSFKKEYEPLTIPPSWRGASDAHKLMRFWDS